MAVRLTITERDDPSSEYVRSFLQDRIVIGRARSSDICLPDMAVSTRHAEIRLKGNDYAVQDLGSLNSTQVNEKKLVAYRPRVLKNGECIEIAGFRVRFELGAASGPADPRDASMRHAQEMLLRILARTGEQAKTEALVVVKGPGRASRFSLPGPSTRLVIGRSPEAAIRLDDRDASWNHAEIVVGIEGIFVRDLGSRNGLLIDGERAQAAKLEHGTHFTVGQTTLVFEHPTESSLVAIFEAPEEETSSFAMAINKDETADVAAKGPAKVEEKRETPPVGPADPLIGDGERARPHLRNTGDIVRPVVEDRSDLGLIVVGAIITLAAVVALIYLFS